MSTPPLVEAPRGATRFAVQAAKLGVQTLDGMRALRRSFAEQYAYGHREVLLQWAELPQTAHLAGGVQHGVWHGPGLQIFPLRDRWGRLPKYWVWNESLAREARSNGLRKVLSIGSPWSYLCAALDINAELEGSHLGEQTFEYVIFPGHSTDSEYDVSNLAAQQQQANDYREFVGPARSLVCLYWTDFFSPTLRAAFEEQGFAVTTAGLGVGSFTPWSPVGGRVRFLANLHGILTSANHYVGETWSTSTAYAASLGKTIHLLPEIAERRKLMLGGTVTSVADSRSYEVETTRWLSSTYPGLVNDPVGSRDTFGFAREVLGFGEVKEPSELEEILDYRIGVVPDLGQRPW
jgi:hypothetical protein